MSKFPKPVALPSYVDDERQKRNQLIVRAAKIGIGMRLLVICIELFGSQMTSSASLFTDAVASLADVISSLFLIVFIQLATRPPDEDHPFGHGRYEPIGGLLLGLLYIAMGGFVLVQQVSGLPSVSNHIPINTYAWAFSLLAMILLEVSYRLIILTAKKQHSPALAADAFHYRIDGLTSLMATIALVAAAYVPSWSGVIDHVGAILIALLMIFLGLYAARENFNQVMDKAPEEGFFVKVREAAKKVGGVRETEKIRIQSYGPDAHVDIDIEVDPQLTVDIAHRITQEVRAEIQKTWPAVRDVTVHVEPYYANDH